MEGLGAALERKAQVNRKKRLLDGDGEADLACQFEAAAWQSHRNASAKPVNWRFLKEVARIELKSLFPSIQ